MPHDLLVLPVGFRPTSAQDILVTGTHVHEMDGSDYAGGPTQTFTLRVYPSGVVRYVDGPELDHVGYLRYAVGTPASGVNVTWQTDQAVQIEGGPAVDLQREGDFINRSVHWAGFWDLRRTGNGLAGTVGSTRSAVQYAG